MLCGTLLDADAVAPADIAVEPSITLDVDGARVTLLGTAHVSRASVEAVRQRVETGSYDVVALELCAGRHAPMVDPDYLSRFDLTQVFRRRKGAMVMASLVLGAFQQRMASQLEVEPGADMRAGIEAAAAAGIPTALIDRDVGVTLRRTYAGVPWWRRLRIFTGLLAGFMSKRTVSAEEIEQLKQSDVVEAAFGEYAAAGWDLQRPLVEERDQYMAARLRQLIAEGHRSILAVVGAGHLPGIARLLRTEAGRPPEAVCAELSQVPRPGLLWRSLPWLIVGVLLAGFAAGFAKAPELGWQLVWSWVIIHGGLAAIGAVLAAGHPLTVMSAFAAAPITALNPAVGAGVVTAAVETWARKPSVADFSRLRADTARVRGWWSNRVARTFLVFMFTGLGSSVGTYVVGYQIVEAIGLA